MNARAGTRLGVVLGTALALLGSNGLAAATLEDQVKAAFLLNFAKFVDWPAEKFPSSQSPLLLCVLDSSNLAQDFGAVLAGKQVGDREVRVESRDVARSQDCHIAYFSSDHEPAVRAALAELAGSGALSVYQTAQPLPGGAIRFFIQDRRIRFEIDPRAASREEIKISSKLLQVAAQRSP